MVKTASVNKRLTRQIASRITIRLGELRQSALLPQLEQPEKLLSILLKALPGGPRSVKQGWENMAGVNNFQINLYVQGHSHQQASEAYGLKYEAQTPAMLFITIHTELDMKMVPLRLLTMELTGLELRPYTIPIRPTMTRERTGNR